MIKILLYMLITCLLSFNAFLIALNILVDNLNKEYDNAVVNSEIDF